MGDVLQNDRTFAKRRHPRPCQVTGLAIEAGDRFHACTYVDGGEFCRFKALAIICDVVNEAWPNYEWMDFEACDGLWEWLIERLPEAEAKLCLDAALQFWRETRV